MNSETKMLYAVDVAKDIIKGIPRCNGSLTALAECFITLIVAVRDADAYLARRYSSVKKEAEIWRIEQQSQNKQGDMG